MNKQSMLAFVRYQAWANDKVLATAAALTDEDLRAPDTHDRGSAFDTIRHLVDVDWSWREFCAGNDVGEGYVWDFGFTLDDIASIRAFSLEEGRRLRAYVESLDDAALAEPLPLSDEPGDSVPRWLVLAHIVNHGTQHRSELARYFTVCGHSPGDIDLLDALTLPWPGEDA